MRRAMVAVAVVLGALAVGAPAGDAQEADPLVYVALGDSFTSGPLVLPTAGPLGCVRSARNYPSLLAGAIGADVFRDVSCGGATINSLYQQQDLVDGKVNPPQLDALDETTDVVTIGMGGNDVGFVGLALDCVRLLPVPLSKPCTPDYTSGGVDQVSRDIDDMGVEMAQAIQDVHAAAPNADIYVVGYPVALPHSARACWPYVPILQQDMPYLVAKYQEMNAELATQAAANGAVYVDTYTSSIGHDVCQLPLIAWMNALVLVPLAAPAHPNELSFVNTARVLRQVIAG